MRQGIPPKVYQIREQLHLSKVTLRMFLLSENCGPCTDSVG